MNCRFCNKKLTQLFVSLGATPLSNAYLKKEQLATREAAYPLDVYVCGNCFLVQLPEFENPENIFSDYAYFSSYSETWLRHAKDYVDKMTRLLGIGKSSQVIEIASNDGYLLQYFQQNGVPVLGIEPARNVAEVAQKRGIPTRVEFFGMAAAKRLVAEGKAADLLLGNNVLAHVPDLNDFVAGLKILLKPHGVITMEFPHLLRLIEENQFDTIYHEHFSYFSLLTVIKVFATQGLRIYDVEEIPTHGGSLRIFVCHQDGGPQTRDNVGKVLEKEKQQNLDQLSGYAGLHAKAQELRRDFRDFLLKAKSEGKPVAAYGAAAKGNTLLNFCGVQNDLVDFVADASPHKQGKYLPGSHIPIVSEAQIKKNKPKYIVILPWNIKEEIVDQLDYIRDWGGQFVTAVPRLEIA